MVKRILRSNYFWLIGLSLLSQAYFFNRGFLTHDEGNILHAAQRILGGDIIYKDFMYPYTPGFVFTTALSFKVFGESILAGRLMMLVVSTLTTLTIFEIVKTTSNNGYLGIVASLIYLSWGPTHINFPWHSMFAILSGSLTILLLLLGDKKKRGIFFLLTGVTSFATFLFKQNFGVAILATIFITYIFNRKVVKRKYILNFFLGYALSMLIFEVYLVLTDSLFDFISNFYRITIEEILLNNSLTTPFIYEYSVRGLLKTAIYLIPAAISILYIYLTFKNKKAPKLFISIGLFTLLFYLLGIRPVTDYTRLSILMSLVGLPLVLSIRLSKNLKLILNLVAFILIFSGYYTALFFGYYRWETPLVRQNEFLDDSRAKIYTDKKYFNVVQDIGPIVGRYTKEGDYIFSYKHAPMFYFLFDRKNPTRYLSIARGSFTNVDPKEVINDLREKNVKLVILQSFDITNKDPIVDFVHENYDQVLSTPDYTVLVSSNI